ncbi:MAG: DUF1003 domain-containing protein [Pseudomonadota bacterium]
MPSPPDIEDSTSDQAAQNIGALLEYYAHEERQLTPAQRLVETLGSVIGQPVFPFSVLAFVVLWIGVNMALHWSGRTEWDPAPFFVLQGMLCLGSLLTGTIVLAKQNRMAQLAEQRAHLDLRITLLTEQKAAKLIGLLEELRRDLPGVKNRDDTEASTLGQPMNPESVRAALDEHKEAAAAVAPRTQA